ncbi:MAG: TonB-dependent receptor, partial [Bacteroides sp.]|nr:TonB-dependent receptor [Bacteroides sp.]
DLTGGLSTTFEAFGFDLNIQTAFQVCGYVWDSFYTSLMNSGSRGQNMHKDMFNRWTPTNTNTNIPALGYDMQDQSASGDFALTKASYFSLRNLTVGYTLPTNMMKKVGINKLRVYLTGDNIWLKSKRKGLDPRQSFSGSTGYTYSALSTYSIGLNLSF